MSSPGIAVVAMVTALREIGFEGRDRGMAFCSAVMGQCMRWAGQE